MEMVSSTQRFWIKQTNIQAGASGYDQFKALRKVLLIFTQINLPFGGISLAVVFFFFTNPERQYSYMSVKDRIKEIDLLGALFLICSIVCLLLALQWGGTTYPWHNSKIWGCLLGFGLLIIIFIGLQVHRGDRATLPPKILGQRTILASSLFTSFFSMALYTYVGYFHIYSVIAL
jgi:hypothetical protein